MRAYDFVIAGGGLAGLSLACQMVRSPLCGASILIVDRQPAGSRDRLWSYWTAEPTIFDPIVEHAWRRLHIGSQAYSKTLDLDGCRYELIRGAELDRFARRELALHANVDFCQGEVQKIEDGPRGAAVTIGGQAVRAGWVFDSTGWPSPSERPAGGLAMYFDGWMVETAGAVFDPEAVTFLDTRTAQRGGLRFFYVLPYSDHRALVEYVVYAPARPSRGEARAAMEAYLRSYWGTDGYQVVGEEAGCLPIIARHRSRRLSRHTLAVGGKAGLIKPTTGFAFRSIQQDSAAIVGSLLRTAQPWGAGTVSGRHRLYDALLLEVLARRGDELQAIFANLFDRNPLGRVLRFLDETTTPAEDLALIATLPARAFLEAIPRYAAAKARQRLS
jgi:lycopene beta-cyclase